MKDKKFKVSYKIILLITFVLIYTSTVFVLSATGTDSYNSLLIINKNSSNTIAPLFKSNDENKENIFYPGYSTQSVLRVKNELGENVTINRLGMDIVLNSRYVDGEILPKDNEKYQAFMDQMKITVRHKNFLTNLYEGTLYSGSFKNFSENIAKTNLKLNKGDSVDLVYTIEMLETGAPQNSSSGIKANIVFNFNIVGNDIPGDNSGPGGEPGDNKKPSDIDKEHWAHDCIVALLREQIITGYDDGTIKPENNITREEVAAVIAKAIIYKDLDIKTMPNNYKSIYTDRISKWALEYVNITTYNEIYSGYPDNTFRGSRNITREEAAKVIAIAFNKGLLDDFELTFNDNNKISNWSMQYIKALAKDNVIKGYPDNTFKPKNEITRAEFFTIICNELELHNLKSDKE